MLRTVLFSSSLLLCAPAFAVYKCQNNGTVSYSDQPCPGGKELRIDATSDTEAAKQQLANDKKALQQLERERHRREARQEREEQKAERTRAAKQKTCAKLALHNKWAKEDVASATPKTEQKEKRKARRAEERYTAECGA